MNWNASYFTRLVLPFGYSNPMQSLALLIIFQPRRSDSSPLRLCSPAFIRCAVDIATTRRTYDDLWPQMQGTIMHLLSESVSSRRGRMMCIVCSVGNTRKIKCSHSHCHFNHFEASDIFPSFFVVPQHPNSRFLLLQRNLKSGNRLMISYKFQMKLKRRVNFKNTIWSQIHHNRKIQLKVIFTIKENDSEIKN